MPENSNRLFRLTIAIFVLGVAGCSGNKSVSPENVHAQAFADLRIAVRDAVADQEREDAAIEIMGQLEIDVQNLRESLTRRRAELKRLHANYDTTKEELIEFSNSIQREIQDNQQHAFEAHQALIAVTTPDEWSMLTKAGTKSMKAVTRSLEGI